MGILSGFGFYYGFRVCLVDRFECFRVFLESIIRMRRRGRSLERTLVICFLLERVRRLPPIFGGRGFSSPSS